MLGNDYLATIIILIYSTAKIIKAGRLILIRKAVNVIINTSLKMSLEFVKIKYNFQIAIIINADNTSE